MTDESPAPDPLRAVDQRISSGSPSRPAAIVVAIAGDIGALRRARAVFSDQGFHTVSWAPEATSAQLLVTELSEVDRTVPAIKASRMPLLLIGDPDEGQSIRVAYDAFDLISEAFEPDDLIRRAYALLARRGYLHLLVARFDPQASLLAQNSHAEWVRCRTGIVGMIRLETPASGDRLRELLVTATAAAHSLLDELSTQALASDDLWNLVLLISLPWDRADAATDSDVMAILTETEHDLTGSRKVCLWQGTSPLSHISGFVAADSPWVPSSSNPLREELQRIARDAIEYDALTSIFKRRLLESDVDRIIETLRRSTSE